MELGQKIVRIKRITNSTNFAARIGNRLYFESESLKHSISDGLIPKELTNRNILSFNYLTLKFFILNTETWHLTTHHNSGF